MGWGPCMGFTAHWSAVGYVYSEKCACCSGAPRRMLLVKVGEGGREAGGEGGGGEQNWDLSEESGSDFFCSPGLASDLKPPLSSFVRFILFIWWYLSRVQQKRVSFSGHMHKQVAQTSETESSSCLYQIKLFDSCAECGKKQGNFLFITIIWVLS